VLIVNQVLLSSLWYIASYWYPNLRSIEKVVTLIKNYLCLAGLSYWASGGLLEGEPGGRPCPLRLI
jgi:hypothetical protein